MIRHSIKEEVGISVYVIDKLRGFVLQSDLKGYQFIEVWDSENTVEVEKEKKLRFEQKMEEIEQTTSTKVQWGTAHEWVENGKAVASGEWKLQKDKNGRILLGQLTMDLKYVWIDPMYYPPILFGLLWHEVERSDI